jgi:3D (Asp-Asp-Asp) domain-containing protein
LPQRQKRAPRPAQGRGIHGARRTVISLSVPAIMLLAGPASATTPPTSATHRAGKPAKVPSATATSSQGHKGASATKHAMTPIESLNEQMALAKVVVAAHAAKTRREAAQHDPALAPKTATAHKATTTAYKASTPAKTGAQVAQDGHVGTTVAPVHHIARQQEPPSQPTHVPLGVFMVTCYDLTGPTASGALAGPESVAVDPSVIPLGTTIYVPGVGDRTADDTGGMIIGDHIDIWEPSYAQCADWGVRYVPIYRVQ